MLKLIDANPGEAYDPNRPIGRPTDEGSLPEDFAEKLPQMMLESGIPAIEITGGGEPTLWRGFDRLLENLISAKIEIGLVTNGSQLNEKRIDMISKGVKWIRFSFDSSNETTHRQVHGTPNFDFNRRIELLKKLVRARRDAMRVPNDKDEGLTIGVSFIITPVNLADVEAAADLFSSLGVDHMRFSWMYDKTGNAGLVTGQIYDVKSRLDKIKERLERPDFKILYERGRIDTYSKPNDDFQKCYMQNFVWAVGADGDVYPCCIMKYHKGFSFGNLKSKSLKDIIDDSNTLAKMHNLDVTKCFPCWLRARNQHIEKAVKRPVHANFI